MFSHPGLLGSRPVIKQRIFLQNANFHCWVWFTLLANFSLITESWFWNFFRFASCCKLVSLIYLGSIYPSRRHNLPPTLEIIFRNFPPKKIQILQKFRKFPKFQNFSKIFKMFKNFCWLGVYNIKHNLVRSCFKFWLSKSAPRLTKKFCHPRHRFWVKI